MVGAEVTLFSEPKEAITDEDGVATFNDVEVGEHTLKIAYQESAGEQELFFNDDAPELSLDITPELVEGVHPLTAALSSLLAAVIAGVTIWYLAKRRFTGHFMV